MLCFNVTITLLTLYITLNVLRLTLTVHIHTDTHYHLRSCRPITHNQTQPYNHPSTIPTSGDAHHQIKARSTHIIAQGPALQIYFSIIMDKLKSLGSKMTFNSTPGGKLSKAFRFDKDLNVLKRSNDPFTDGPTLEDVSHFDNVLMCAVADGVSSFCLSSDTPLPPMLSQHYSYNSHPYPSHIYTSTAHV